MSVPVDLIVTGEAVLTVDRAGTILLDGAVAIREGIIVDVGTTHQLLADYRAAEVLHNPGCLVMPGWVNVHTHLAMNIFRGAADDVSLEEFLDRLVSAEMRVLSEEMVTIGARAAIAECFAGGITTALDMYWYPQAARAVARESGFRLLNGPTFMGDLDPDGRDFNGMLSRAEEILQENRAENPNDALWVMPHSSYTLSAEQLGRIHDLAARYGARINVHCSESLGEIDLVEQLHQDRPLAVLTKAGLLDRTTMLAHAVHLTKDEIAQVATAGANVAHCPVSNLKLGCGIAPIAELLTTDVPLGLGTDGAASTGALDMFAVVRMAALLHKGTTKDPTMVKAEHAVRLGTIEGARSLGLTTVGTLEKGMRADLQVLRTSTLNAAPGTDPWSTAVYGAAAGDVKHTIVDGRVVMLNRVLQTIDQTSAIQQASAAAKNAFRE
ncbi:amidohydrolase family protein [Arthrobacter castelli]|uniref:amidohydrolase family protein n=1 Tax=Arthrobacter castelli TaxID=271431 RepID=UPI0003F8B4B0|nr:amidohydrolase [Arthrobacter castelli]